MEPLKRPNNVRKFDLCEHYHVDVCPPQEVKMEAFPAIVGSPCERLHPLLVFSTHFFKIPSPHESRRFSPLLCLPRRNVLTFFPTSKQFRLSFPTQPKTPELDSITNIVEGLELNRSHKSRIPDSVVGTFEAESIRAWHVVNPGAVSVCRYKRP